MIAHVMTLCLTALTLVVGLTVTIHLLVNAPVLVVLIAGALFVFPKFA